MIDLTSFSDISRNVAMATNFVKNGKLPFFIALAFRNVMGYRYLNVCINSENDASISCKNFVNFGPVTPELTELICERQVRHDKKLAYLVEYLRIYWTDCRNLFTIWKRFKCRWWLCQGILLCQPNYLGWNEKVMKADWYRMHSLHVCQVAAWLCFATTC